MGQKPRPAGEREPIAIVGMGCRYPGDVTDGETFWRLLVEGRDTVTSVPASRWNLASFLDPTGEAPRTTYTGAGSFLTDIDGFDAPFFEIAPNQAVAMDPQHRLLLEVSWEALESTGESPTALVDTNTGIFVGMLANEYESVLNGAKDPSPLEPHITTGNIFSLASGRLAYFYGTHGPAVTLNTACSSSLVATHIACQSLLTYECDRALVCAVNLLLSPTSYVELAKMRALSRRERCSTFDAKADGFVRAEGCGVLVLKRLEDAVADRNRILAVIRGSSVNQDGRRTSVATPNAVAQRRLMETALGVAGLAPSAVSYIEAHGTGTPLGDPIEMQAIVETLAKDRPADDPLFVGSVKTNFGHAESAAGMAGLIKTVLALEHGKIPAHLHLEHINPRIALGDAPVRIPTELTDWPARPGQKRVAGVSSFGLGGTNGHVVLEEWTPEPAPRPTEPTRPSLLTLSAKSEPALRALAARYVEWLRRPGDEALEDIAYTAHVGRAQLPSRLGVVASDRSTMADRLAAWCAQEPAPFVVEGTARETAVRKLAFLFSGGGTQYPHMGESLYRTQPVFRASLDRATDALRGDLEVPLRDVMWAKTDALAARLDDPTYMYPAIVAIELALYEVWRSWGLEPTMVLGHSLGEYSAAIVSGILEPEGGLRLVTARGRLVDTLPRIGGAISTQADEATVRAALEGLTEWVGIAALNGPKSTVVSGRTRELEEVTARLEAQGIKCKVVRVSHAHSPLLEPIVGDLEKVAATIEHRAPKIPIVSNLLAEAVTAPGVITPSYWRRHLREPVRFADGMKLLFGSGHRVFLEVGPSPTLIGMGQLCMPANAVWAKDTAWCGSLKRNVPEHDMMLESMGRLHARGWALRWDAIDPDAATRARVELPRYPFQRKRYWVDASVADADRSKPAAPEKARAALMDALAGVPADGKVDAIRRFIAEKVRLVLGIPAEREVADTDDLATFGMDSLLAIELSKVIQRSVGDALVIPNSFLFERPTIGAITEHLAARLVTNASAPTPAATIAHGPERWLRHRGGAPEAKVRLICFHYAGGSAQVFMPWLAKRPPWLELCLVQLPGRWERSEETPFDTMAPLVEALASALGPTLKEKPYALLGYSVGAMVAAELARYTVTHELPPPVHLFSVASAAPHAERSIAKSPIARLPDAEFLEGMKRRYGSKTTEIFANGNGGTPEMLRALRADMRLGEEYVWSDGPPFSFPITALGGKDDDLVPASGLEQWRERTTSRFELAMFDGGHFFLHSEAGIALFEAVRASLARDWA